MEITCRNCERNQCKLDRIPDSRNKNNPTIEKLRGCERARVSSRIVRLIGNRQLGGTGSSPAGLAVFNVLFINVKLFRPPGISRDRIGVI